MGEFFFVLDVVNRGVGERGDGDAFRPRLLGEYLGDDDDDDDGRPLGLLLDGPGDVDLFGEIERLVGGILNLEFILNRINQA